MNPISPITLLRPQRFSSDSSPPSVNSTQKEETLSHNLNQQNSDSLHSTTTEDGENSIHVTNSLNLNQAFLFHMPEERKAQTSSTSEKTTLVTESILTKQKNTAPLSSPINRNNLLIQQKLDGAPPPFVSSTQNRETLSSINLSRSYSEESSQKSTENTEDMTAQETTFCSMQALVAFDSNKEQDRFLLLSQNTTPETITTETEESQTQQQNIPLSTSTDLNTPLAKEECPDQTPLPAEEAVEKKTTSLPDFSRRNSEVLNSEKTENQEAIEEKSSNSSKKRTSTTKVYSLCDCVIQ